MTTISLPIRTFALLIFAFLFFGDLLAPQQATAQSESPHFQNWADLPPGEIGRRQLERGGPLRGYFQPVELQAPEGCIVSFYVDGEFSSADSSNAKAGMLIGEVYRARVTQIPKHSGFEIYPSIEVINRLFPPQGQEDRFPIPIVISQDDLDRALAGEYIVRVIYLEDPSIALPLAQPESGQRTDDVNGGDDPLIAADKLGRPMAIIRIGARIPDEAVGAVASPPIQILDQQNSPSTPISFERN